MKRVVFLTIIALASSLSLSAQRPERPRFDANEMASKTVSELSEKIEMSTSVQDSVKLAFITFFNKMNSDRQSDGRPNILNFEKERDLKVKTFLSEEQFKIYSKFMEERKPKGEGPGNENMNERQPRLF